MKSQPKSFDAIEIGDEIGPVWKTPTKETVLRYADAVRITGLKFFFHQKDAEQAGLTKPSYYSRSSEHHISLSDAQRFFCGLPDGCAA